MTAAAGLPGRRSRPVRMITAGIVKTCAEWKFSSFYDHMCSFSRFRTFLPQFRGTSGFFVHAWTFFPFLPQFRGTSGFFVHAWTNFPFLPQFRGTSGFFVHPWTFFPFLPQFRGTSGFFVHAWTNFPFLPQFRGTSGFFVHAWTFFPFLPACTVQLPDVPFRKFRDADKILDGFTRHHIFHRLLRHVE